MSSAPSLPPFTVRPLGEEHAAEFRRLGHEAFGVPPAPAPAGSPAAGGATEAPPSPYRPGMQAYGAVADVPTAAGTHALLARLVDRDYESWFGGAAIPTCGVAGVTVATEFRGAGLLRTVFATLLEGARKRGAVISTLFPTAPAIYRGFGFEIVGDMTSVTLPTGALAAVRDDGTARVRRATVEDVPALRAVFDTWAAAQNGPLTRRGPSFPTTDAELVASFTGITVALDADERVTGFASWDRGQGFGSQAQLTVADLVTLDAGATRALLRSLGGFASVCSRTRFSTSPADLARYVVPTTDWSDEGVAPYMLRLLDPARAFGLRRWPAHLAVDLGFTWADEHLRDLDGGWRLRVRDGSATCERDSSAAGPLFTGRGMAVAYAGAQSVANLRMAGLVSGPDGDDAVWDSLLGGRQVHVRDYF